MDCSTYRTVNRVSFETVAKSPNTSVSCKLLGGHAKKNILSTEKNSNILKCWKKYTHLGQIRQLGQAANVTGNFWTTQITIINSKINLLRTNRKFPYRIVREPPVMSPVCEQLTSGRSQSKTESVLDFTMWCTKNILKKTKCLQWWTCKKRWRVNSIEE